MRFGNMVAQWVVLLSHISLVWDLNPTSALSLWNVYVHPGLHGFPSPVSYMPVVCSPQWTDIPPRVSGLKDGWMDVTLSGRA